MCGLDEASRAGLYFVARYLAHIVRASSGFRPTAVNDRGPLQDG